MPKSLNAVRNFEGACDLATHTAQQEKQLQQTVPGGRTIWTKAPKLSFNNHMFHKDILAKSNTWSGCCILTVIIRNKRRFKKIAAKDRGS